MTTITVVDTPVQLTVVETEINGIVVQQDINLLDLSAETVTLSLNETVVLIDRSTGLIQVPVPTPIKELYDQNTPPVAPVDTYLRFERNLAGKVTKIYLGNP